MNIWIGNVTILIITIFIYFHVNFVFLFHPPQVELLKNKFWFDGAFNYKEDAALKRFYSHTCFSTSVFFHAPLLLHHSVVGAVPCGWTGSGGGGRVGSCDGGGGQIGGLLTVVCVVGRGGGTDGLNRGIRKRNAYRWSVMVFEWSKWRIESSKYK